MFPSVFGGLREISGRPSLDDGSPLVAVLSAVLERRPAGAAVVFDDLWCHVRPDRATHPDQGWKLHVSATEAAAPQTLARVAEVLFDECCAFKFASTPDRLRMLNSSVYPRPGAAKFITAYPADDEVFVRLAHRLHEVTEGQPGPAVLSDRRYADDSVVHYRYGGFSHARILTNDAEYVGALTVGERLVPDERKAWHSPPPWARDPLGNDEPPATASEVLLNGRFVVRSALRHASRGGVFRGTDRADGSDVVVKQARRHVTGNSGVEAREGLRHEARVLRALAGTGCAPAVRDEFEQGGDQFLVEDFVPGKSLRLWARERAGVVGPSSNTEPGIGFEEARAVLRALVAVLRSVHAAGWVLRDLSPNNVIVADDGAITLVDLEFAAEPGSRVAPGGTPGYTAPEQAAGAPVAEPADLFSLGAIAFLLITSVDPVFPADQPRGHTATDRIEEWLGTAARFGRAARALGPLVLGLTDATADARWSLDRADRFLRQARPVPVPGTPSPWTDELADALLSDGIDHLCAEFDRDGTPEKGPWPRSCAAGTVDPANVQHGAAGIIGVLARAARYHPRAKEVLADACAWVRRYLRHEAKTLPGLHFGRTGTALALHRAAGVLGDDDLRAEAVALAERVPVEWENPDVAHGLAGAGFGQLQFWRLTGREVFRQRFTGCARDLAARARRVDGTVRWPIPETFDSRLAGLVHHGYAHGSAGVAAFLLAAGSAADRRDWVDLAVETGTGLVASAVRTDAGAALWPSSPEDPVDPMEHWCSGSAGVATFLLDLWRVTGDPSLRDHLDRAARAVHQRRWHAAPVQCHGLAGNGEYLLDLADATGEPRYRDWAAELAWTAWLRHAVRDGRRLVPDESNIGFGLEHGIGMAGHLAFLLRLRHGLGRLWTGDPTDERGRDDDGHLRVADAAGAATSGSGGPRGVVVQPDVSVGHE